MRSTLEIEVFGTVPVVGRLALPIHSEPLSGDNKLHYGCRVAGGRLTLDGQLMTPGRLSASDADEYVMIKVD